MSLKGFVSSHKQDWKTPKKVYRWLNNIWKFDFDPCPVNPKFDGLNVEWGKSNYVNPPFNQMGKWVEKAYSEYLKGKKVIMLIPARTDTAYFHKYLMRAAQIWFIKGRLKYDDGKNPAPFPTMIVIFDSNYNKCVHPEDTITKSINQKETWGE